MSSLIQQRIDENRRTKAKNLTLTLSNMNDIPDELGELTWLESLTISEYPRKSAVSDLRPLSSLSELRYLNLEGTSVTDLRPLAPLSRLQHVILSSTRVRDTSPLALLSSLKRLFLDHNAISDLRPLESLQALELLYLSSTAVSDLSPLASLLSLRTLELSNTKVSDISPLYQLIKNGRKVCCGPLSGAGIGVGSCPLTNPPEFIVKQGNIAILNYFSERKGGVDYLFEAKLLILGEGGAGKTSLLRRMFLPGQSLPMGDESTKGIAIYNHVFTMENGRPFRLNVWDFGGQEIYHATHQFFLTQRSVYVLLDDTTKDWRSVQDGYFQYWLDFIQAFGGDSPVLIFQNEKSGRSKEIDLRGIRERYWTVRDAYRGDLKHKDAAARFRAEIEHVAGNLSHVGEELPAGWLKVREDIEARAKRVPFISQQEYFNIYKCYLHPFTQEKALHLSRALHDLGVFLHFQDDLQLKWTVILQNEWATDAVFKILDDETIKAKRGRFGSVDCERIWVDSKYSGKHLELVALMKKFELCYELRDTNPVFWLAPQLLPAAKPNALNGWEDGEDLVLRYRYTFMPKALLSRLTVRLHQFVEQLEKAWVNGVLFERNSEDGKTTVLAHVLPDGRHIELRARGGGRKEFLNVISADLDNLNDSFVGLKGKIDTLVPCRCKECKQSTEPYFYKYSTLLRRKERRALLVSCERSFIDMNVIELLDGIKVEDLRKSVATKAITSLRTIRIFLASSVELRADRDEFDRYFNRQNDEWMRNGVYLSIERWEHFFDAISSSRLQDEYNDKVRECDVFIALFFCKAGKYTIEEFEVAHEHFTVSGRPKIFTYFKNAEIMTGSVRPEDMNAVWSLKQKLEALGHYPTEYRNIEDLKLQFGDQLKMLAAKSATA